MAIDKFGIYFDKIEKFKAKMSNNPNYRKVFIDYYRYLIHICPNFFDEYKSKPEFTKLIDEIEKCEGLIPKGYILDTKPITATITLMSYPSTEDLLDYIVYTTKEFIALRKPDIDIATFDFTNFCGDAVMILEDICSSLDIEFERFDLEPGFTSKPEVYNGTGYHYSGIALINGDYYLIDPTYRQFFTNSNNFLERIFIPYTSGCLPGAFMTMNDTRLYVAQTLIKRGWIKLNDEIYKAYLDGFAISYRNGIYYENTDDFSFTTNYTVDDYQRFINSDDNQINYEGINAIGYQLRPCRIKKDRIKNLSF